jgi:hypothetical protein
MVLQKYVFAALPMMPLVANSLAVIFAVISMYVLYLAKKAPSVIRRTILGGILYITVSIVIMAAGQ